MPGLSAQLRGMLSIAPGTKDVLRVPLGWLRSKNLDAHRFVPTHWLCNRANFVPFLIFSLLKGNKNIDSPAHTRDVLIKADFSFSGPSRKRRL